MNARDFIFPTRFLPSRQLTPAMKRIAAWFDGMYWTYIRRRPVHCWKGPPEYAEELFGYGTVEYWDYLGEIEYYKDWGDNNAPLMMCMCRSGHFGPCQFIDGSNIKLTFVEEKPSDSIQ